MEDLYRILNCEESASQQQMKKAYQELALKYHPDKSKCGNNTAENFIKINRAWTVLSDPWLRQQYDAKWKERCLAQTFPIQDTVDFEEFDEIVESNECDVGETTNSDSSKESDINSSDNVFHMYPCRCGGNYILTSVDVKLKFDIVCCDTCSLTVKVIYNGDQNS